MADGDGTGRRGALAVLVKAGGVAFGCALGGPALVFAAGPFEGKDGGRGRWVRTVKLEALHEGEPKKVAIVADQRDAWTLTKGVELGAAWLVRKGDQVTALSATCPHLGCTVMSGATGAYLCPCHSSSFAADGKRETGPSPRGLDALDTKIEDGFVLVDFRTYRTGTPDKVETG